MTDTQGVVDLSADDKIMLALAKNVINIHKSNESDKIGFFKYFAAIVTGVVSIVMAIVRFTSNTFTDYFVISAILALLYTIGIVVLRKLFAVRKTEVMLSAELGNNYRYFINKYPSIGQHVGLSFKLVDSTTPRINRGGSDYFSLLMIAIINTAVLFSALLFLVSGIEGYLKASSNTQLSLSWLTFAGEALIILGNLYIFVKFERLTKSE